MRREGGARGGDEGGGLLERPHELDSGMESSEKERRDGA